MCTHIGMSDTLGRHRTPPHVPQNQTVPPTGIVSTPSLVHPGGSERPEGLHATPNLPTNIVPTNIARLKLSGNFPMNLGIPPL